MDSAMDVCKKFLQRSCPPAHQHRCIALISSDKTSRNMRKYSGVAEDSPRDSTNCEGKIDLRGEKQPTSKWIVFHFNVDPASFFVCKYSKMVGKVLRGLLSHGTFIAERFINQSPEKEWRDLFVSSRLQFAIEGGFFLLIPKLPKQENFASQRRGSFPRTPSPLGITHAFGTQNGGVFISKTGMK